MAKYRKLGRTSDQRKALLRNQVTNLLYHGKIVTTETKAKEIRKIAESMIALAVKEKDNFETVTVTAKVARKDADGKRVKEVKDGKKRSVQRKVFPGYVLVEMIVNDRSWYAVRNTPGVTGFVGSGTKPIPLTEDEVKQIMRSMGVEESRPKIDLQLQQMVRLKTGPFAGCIGSVSEINEERGKLKVLVDMFGRETPVEIDFTQVEEAE